jgi:hypothetical protein
VPRPGGGWFLVDVVASWSSCRPSLKVTIEAEDEHGDRAGGGNATAAARIVQAIPFVCQAAPGLLDALAVPLQVGRGLLWV